MRYKKLLITFFYLAFLSLMPFQIIAAEASTGLIPSECASGGASACSPSSFIKVFVNAANLIVGLTGVAALAMFIWGGILMITAYGNEQRAKSGKEVITAAITGIIIIFLAWTLVNLLVTSLSNSQANWFNIPATSGSA